MQIKQGIVAQDGGDRDEFTGQSSRKSQQEKVTGYPREEAEKIAPPGTPAALTWDEYRCGDKHI